LNSDAKLDKIEVENVRMSLANNISISNIDRAHIWEWLRQKDEERRAADLRYARWTLGASIVAAVAGIAAVIIGLIGLK
jgi:hypothetical protein